MERIHSEGAPGEGDHVRAADQRESSAAMGEADPASKGLVSRFLTFVDM
jgi:hypothetical protein